MRTTTLVLNSIVVLFFGCFLAYTIVARSHLESLARQFVTEKTLAYSKPIVAIAEEALDTPIVKTLLTEEKTKTIQKEIADYHLDPLRTITDLTRQPALNAPEEKGNQLMSKVASIKNKIRKFYHETLVALISDLRVFAFCNLIASSVAFVLAWRTTLEIRRSIVWFSFLILIAVIYCSYLYVDSLSFFRILFRAHFGWKYAIFLCFVIAVLVWDFGRDEAQKVVEPKKES